MSHEFVLSPSVIKEATSYVPFRNVTPDMDTVTFEEDATFEGAALRTYEDQTIVDISLKVGEASANGNSGVKFRTSIWLNNAICAGTIRPKDADERDWKGTKAGLRTLSNLATALGIVTENPVTALTNGAPNGLIHAKIRTFKGNDGQIKWELNRISKVNV